MKRDGANNSLWQDTAAFSNITAGVQQTRYDVVIGGAGITGITTGLLLQKAGLNVLIAEAYNPGFGTTGGTTAHLNTFMDTSYDVMIKKFGKDHAVAVSESIAAALQLIKTNVGEYAIDCGYRELPAYLYAQDDKQDQELSEILSGAHEVGVAAKPSDHLPVPVPFTGVAEFPGQASFHPLRYITALLKEFQAAGGVLMENCRITSVEKEGDDLIVQSACGTFNAHHFIYATHIPPGVNLLHLRCAPYRSYAMAVILSNEEDYPDALVYDMYDPYHYLRTQEIDGVHYLIAGGEDHKTGHEENAAACFTRLEAFVRKWFRVKKIAYQWSSQYFEPVDGLPYIGHLPGSPENVHVASGFGGNGMIYSAVAAIVLHGKITGTGSPFEHLFDPERIKPVAGFSEFMKEAADVVSLLAGKLTPAPSLEILAELAPGEAKVIKHEGHKMAVYKDEAGIAHIVNPACTHIKCDVAWNNTERSWDCPCHGSRFDIDGKVLTAPARKDLEIMDWVRANI